MLNRHTVADFRRPVRGERNNGFEIQVTGLLFEVNVWTYDRVYV